MIIGKFYEENKKRTGIYSITNIVNGHCYIGSATVAFHKRYEVHKATLLNGKHKNEYLQRAFVKYGFDSFVFDIIEIVDDMDCILPMEQYWMNITDSVYNINRAATGGSAFTQETIDKRSATTRKTWAEGRAKYTYTVPWNKGIVMNEEQRRVLKVPKTVTAKVLESARSRGLAKATPVAVFDPNGLLLGRFRSTALLEEWSLTEANNLPINSRFNKPRMGKPLGFLCHVNVLNATKTGKPYKGLYFKVDNGI